MAREASKFLARSLNFKSLKLPALALSVLAPATLIALPSAAFRSGDRVYFTSPPQLLDVGTTRPNRQTPSYYEFTLRVPENAGEPLAAVKISQQSGELVTFDPRRSQAESLGGVALSQGTSSSTMMSACAGPSTETTPSSSSSSDVNTSSEQGATETTPSDSPTSDVTTTTTSNQTSQETTRSSDSSIRATQQTGETTSNSSLTACARPSSMMLQSAYRGEMQPGVTNSSTTTSTDYTQMSESERVAYQGASGANANDTTSPQMSRGQSLTLASVGGPDSASSGEVVVQFDPPVRPGTEVKVSVYARNNPDYRGAYVFGVTAYPAGENSYGQFLGYRTINFF